MYEPRGILDNVVKASIENCQYRLKIVVVTKCSKKVFFFNTNLIGLSNLEHVTNNSPVGHKNELLFI